MNQWPAESKFGLTEADLRNNEVFQGEWYHSIELLPGLFTPGKDHQNIWLTRRMLKGCEISHMNCLDIGAMDCLTTLLLKRRGALNVVAYDIRSRPSQVNLLKQHFQLDFHYMSGLKLSELRPITQALGLHPFDVVVFSGVLYHMFDPLSGLALARGMVRHGGLLVLETAAAVDDQALAYLNAGGRFYPGTTYWLVSIETLDYLLRFLRLFPLDCICFGHRSSPENPLAICRIAVVCRAVDHALPYQYDTWMTNPSHELHLNQFLDWQELKTGSREVEYITDNSGLICREDTGTVNLYETVQVSSGAGVDNFDEQVRLKLNAIF